MIDVSPAFHADAGEAQLARDIYAASVGSDLVLLDLAADEYLLLSDSGPLEIDGNCVRGPIETLLMLSAEELLESGEPATARKGPPALPREPLPEAARIQPNLGDVAMFSVIWADAARRRPQLKSLAERFGGRRGRRDDLEAVSARVEIFRQLLPLAPWTGACLFQAQLLLRFLNVVGLDADWVFGVRTSPFLAHCWLQLGDHCVSQRPETLTIYRPIMVL